jgi:hypothetical protein
MALLASVIEHAFGNHIERVELLGGDERYKPAFTSDVKDKAAVPGVRPLATRPAVQDRVPVRPPGGPAGPGSGPAGPRHQALKIPEPDQRPRQIISGHQM